MTHLPARRLALSLCGAAVATLGVAACGGSSNSSSSSAGSHSSSAASSGSCSLPATVNATAVMELTGPVGYAGAQAKNGQQIALAQIQSDGILGKATLNIKYVDNQSLAPNAASAVATAVADKSNVAILGPLDSSTAVITSPLATRAKTPIIYAEAGSSGIVTSSYTFRVHEPQTLFDPLVLKLMKAKNLTRLAAFYTSDIATNAQVATQVLPSAVKAYGASIVASVGLPITGLNFAAAIQKATTAKADAVVLVLNGAAFPAATKQLRQAGFKGLIMATAGASTPVLQPAGTDANGVVWTSTFSPSAKFASTQQFVKAYQAKYHMAPGVFAAEGFDQAYLLAKGIAAGKCGTRESTASGLIAAARAGFSGAQGPLTFDGNDARAEIQFIEHQDGKDVLIKTP